MFNGKMIRLRRLAAPVGQAVLTLVFFWKILLTNRILVGVDVFTYFYPYRDYAAAAVRNLRLPLWNPYLFLGVPFLANSQTAVFYPLHWPLAWLSTPKQIAVSIGLHVFMGSTFAYLYARRSLETSRLAAFLGAAIFALGGFVGAQVEHINQLNVSVWLPLLLLLWDGRHDRRHLLLAGGVVGMMLLAGHTQAAYICLFGWGIYAVVREERSRFSWRERGRNLAKRLALYILVVAVGAGIAAAQLLPTLELAGLSNRSGGLPYKEASAFSLRPQLLPYTLLPTFGEDLTQVFGSEAFSEYIAYLGVLGLFLALVGALFRRDSRHRAALILLAVLGLFLAAGRMNPAYYVLYRFVPGFDLFRAPARWMLLYVFGGAMLAALGADFLFAPREAKAQMADLPIDRLSRRAWRRMLLGGGAVALPVILLSPLLDFPALPTLAAWAGLGIVGLALWANALSERTFRLTGQIALTGLLLVELFMSSRSLAYNRATAPEALSSLRTAPAHLLAEARFGGAIPPARFLSLSDIRYDPGDLADIQAIFADQLPPEAIYDFVVAAKRKEILAPNLPLIYRLPAVDGYDGGLLPLKQYVTLQRLFLNADRLSPDGRLREQLQQVPEGRLLSLLNVQYVITDKVHDVWIDDVFYDLEHEAVLGADAASQIARDDLPDLHATAMGIVSYLETDTALADGEPVAEVTLVDESDKVQRHLLRAGVDTTEENDTAARFSWEEAVSLRSISVRYLAPTGQLHLRGLTLIDERTGAFEPLTLSTSGRFRLVHSGDVKVYENLDALPRATVVHQAQLAADEEAALILLGDPAFDPGTSVVLAAQDAPPELPAPDPGAPDDAAQVVRYEPERVEVEVEMVRAGYLVLSDTHYPGWRARVDGKEQPIYRANLLFRAVYLPTGRHRVTFRFRPDSFWTGIGLSAAMAILVALGWLAIHRHRRAAG